jgi:hypothetical protein
LGEDEPKGWRSKQQQQQDIKSHFDFDFHVTSSVVDDNLRRKKGCSAWTTTSCGGSQTSKVDVIGSKLRQSVAGNGGDWTR